MLGYRPSSPLLFRESNEIIVGVAGCACYRLLSCWVFTDNLQSHFKKYGEIIDAVIMKDRSTGHPRGFGFVTFADPAVCDNVVLDKHVIDGRTVSFGSSLWVYVSLPVEYW